jgi:hypothetical protein
MGRGQRSSARPIRDILDAGLVIVVALHLIKEQQWKAMLSICVAGNDPGMRFVSDETLKLGDEQSGLAVVVKTSDRASLPRLRQSSLLCFNSGLQPSQPLSDPPIGSLRVKVGRMPDLMTDVEGGPSEVVIDRCGEANSAEHDSGAEADGTNLKISQSKHEVPLR